MSLIPSGYKKADRHVPNKIKLGKKVPLNDGTFMSPYFHSFSLPFTLLNYNTHDCMYTSVYIYWMNVTNLSLVKDNDDAGFQSIN